MGIILATTTCDFLAPTRFGDRIIAAAGLTHLGRKSITMNYQIYEKGSGKHLAKGTSVAVMYDYEKGVSVEIPSSVRLRFEEIKKNAVQMDLS